jgi:DNA-binding NarL/FixJ family response regulator
MKVFIADDSSEIRDRILNVVGMFPQLEVVGTAADFIGCVQGLRAKKPDILLLDLQMPGGNGLEVLRELGNDDVPAPKVIVFTNHAQKHYRNACLAQGASYFVDKSGDIEDLKSAIRNAIGDESAKLRLEKPRSIS